MSWLEIDDRFLRHPKFVKAMSQHVHALYAWFGLMTWTKQNLTDGLIPFRVGARAHASLGSRRPSVAIGACSPPRVER